ncbi:LOW QUALITY PROTEIN: M130-like protein [Mya arenaria]|uniref:M130-like protein n=1 Tax=Mya arenaria TaxID=6604 RepID=A0ABY7DW75_MYAAR|nr:LOW QUALITY PROTEIN: M130-like protein [Mya arenaria]
MLLLLVSEECTFLKRAMWNINLFTHAGTRNRLLHAIDVANPSSPLRILTHQFTEHEGNPQAVDVCGGRLAVALSAHVDVLEGHVQFFDVVARGSSVTDIHPDHTLAGYKANNIVWIWLFKLILVCYLFTSNKAAFNVLLLPNGCNKNIIPLFINTISPITAVGAHPKDLKHTPNCNMVLVANEGRPGKDDTNQYLNPEGSITVIVIDRNNDPTLRTIDFQQFNEGEANFNQNIRTPSRYIPKSVYSGTTTVAQDIEPESVVISNDGRYAWVTLLENDAVATLDLRTYQVTKVSPLPKKLWDTSPVDCSDLDGGVHRRTYAGLKSMRQPGKITLLQIGSKNYLITADVGGVTSYTSALHGFTWTDTITARSLVNSLMPDLVELKTQMTDNGFLGRLQVSTIEGNSLFDPRYTHVEMFGGRGFSVWDSTNMAAPTFDSEGTLEEYMDSYYHFLFNTDYAANRATTGSPANDRDTSSENQVRQRARTTLWCQRHCQTCTPYSFVSDIV